MYVVLRLLLIAMGIFSTIEFGSLAYERIGRYKIKLQEDNSNKGHNYINHSIKNKSEVSGGILKYAISRERATTINSIRNGLLLYNNKFRPRNPVFSESFLRKTSSRGKRMDINLPHKTKLFKNIFRKEPKPAYSILFRPWHSMPILNDTDIKIIKKKKKRKKFQNYDEEIFTPPDPDDETENTPTVTGVTERSEIEVSEKKRVPLNKGPSFSQEIRINLPDHIQIIHENKETEKYENINDLMPDIRDTEAYGTESPTLGADSYANVYSETTNEVASQNTFAEIEIVPTESTDEALTEDTSNSKERVTFTPEPINYLTNMYVGPTEDITQTFYDPLESDFVEHIQKLFNIKIANDNEYTKATGSTRSTSRRNKERRKKFQKLREKFKKRKKKLKFKASKDRNHTTRIPINTTVKKLNRDNKQKTEEGNVQSTQKTTVSEQNESSGNIMSSKYAGTKEDGKEQTRSFTLPLEESSEELTNTDITLINVDSYDEIEDEQLNELVSTSPNYAEHITTTVSSYSTIKVNNDQKEIDSLHTDDVTTEIDQETIKYTKASHKSQYYVNSDNDELKNSLKNILKNEKKVPQENELEQLNGADEFVSSTDDSENADEKVTLIIKEEDDVFEIPGGDQNEEISYGNPLSKVLEKMLADVKYKMTKAFPDSYATGISKNFTQKVTATTESNIKTGKKNIGSLGKIFEKGFNSLLRGPMGTVKPRKDSVSTHKAIKNKKCPCYSTTLDVPASTTPGDTPLNMSNILSILYEMETGTPETREREIEVDLGDKQNENIPVTDEDYDDIISQIQTLSTLSTTRKHFELTNEKIEYFAELINSILSSNNITLKDSVQKLARTIHSKIIPNSPTTSTVETTRKAEYINTICIPVNEFLALVVKTTTRTVELGASSARPSHTKRICSARMPTTCLEEVKGVCDEDEKRDETVDEPPTEKRLKSETIRDFPFIEIGQGRTRTPPTQCPGSTSVEENEEVCGGLTTCNVSPKDEEKPSTTTEKICSVTAGPTSCKTECRPYLPCHCSHPSHKEGERNRLGLHISDLPVSTTKKMSEKPKKKYRFYPPLAFYGTWLSPFGALELKDGLPHGYNSTSGQNEYPLAYVINPLSPPSSPFQPIPTAGVKDLSLGAFVFQNKYLPSGFYKLEDLIKLNNSFSTVGFSLIPKTLRIGSEIALPGDVNFYYPNRPLNELSNGSLGRANNNGIWLKVPNGYYNDKYTLIGGEENTKLLNNYKPGSFLLKKYLDTNMTKDMFRNLNALHKNILKRHCNGIKTKNAIKRPCLTYMKTSGENTASKFYSNMDKISKYGFG